MNIKVLLSGFVALLAATAGANAATVSATTSVTAEVDVSAVTPGNLRRYGYSCGATCSGSSSGNPDNLDAGASFLINFGTSAGADDLGSLVFTNPFMDDINNFASAAGLPVDGLALGSLSTLFMTFVFIDDEFAVGDMYIFIDDNILNGTISELSVSDVPLPAALPLFLAGLAGVGAVARRKKKRA
ncbi:VPLPA-CTERM sorting domain-containing protein [Hyphococcus sp.]|uniref:VPLPA-CTERM sorting domain-containing protein n=1 Tax=Hyphococcus sp. TaxID=2038636 RepID=UPI003CCC3081